MTPPAPRYSVVVPVYNEAPDEVFARLEITWHPGLRLQDVRAQLQARYPDAFALVALAAVNGEHQRDSSILLADQSEVVFMSRFSGG